MFISPGFVLVPLYIYPTSTSTWGPLTSAAVANPSLNFLAVINPDSGPAGSCPDDSYAAALNILNSHSNIQTIGYVHSLYGTVDSSTMEQNIADYQNWPSCSTSQDLHVGGIFFDETPTGADKTAYMSGLTDFTRGTLTHGNSTVLFNMGDPPETTDYWGIADYINVFEGSEADYDGADIGALDGAGKYARQATMIIHDYSDDAAIESRDVNTIMSLSNDVFAGLFITELKDATASEPDNNPYAAFPSAFAAFSKDMATAVA